MAVALFGDGLHSLERKGFRKNFAAVKYKWSFMSDPPGTGCGTGRGC